MYLNEGINNNFEDCVRCGETLHSDLIYPNGYCETCNTDMNG